MAGGVVIDVLSVLVVEEVELAVSG